MSKSNSSVRNTFDKKSFVTRIFYANSVSTSSHLALMFTLSLLKEMRCRMTSDQSVPSFGASILTISPNRAGHLMWMVHRSLMMTTTMTPHCCAGRSKLEGSRVGLHGAFFGRRFVGDSWRSMQKRPPLRHNIGGQVSSRTVWLPKFPSLWSIKR